MSVWYFEQRDLRGVLTIPKNHEHFAAVSGIVASLVREVTQNSGDAWAENENEPVQVHFRFGKLEAGRFADHVDGLSEHLETFSDLRAVLETKTVPYLTVEDFGTTGLKGSYDLSVDGTDSDYVAFWRRYGEPSKSGNKGGRHGLGKSTMSDASKLRLFYGVTVREEDPARHVLLQGQISLRPHRSGGKVYGSYGLWYDDTGDLPIMDRATSRFTHDFDLSRGATPGLSVVIPFPRDDLTPDNIIKAVIENTFHQIVTGALIVKVDDTLINSVTLVPLAEQYGLSHFKSAISLSADSKKKDFPRFAPHPQTNRLRTKADHFSENDVQAMRKRWTDGEIVAVDLPVAIHKKSEPREVGTVGLYVVREQNSELARETYVRGCVTVPLRRVAARSNCVGLLVADTGAVSTFLGDAEPPAHHQWHMARVHPHYHSADATLRRILFSLKDLLDLLDEGKEDQAIKDAFLPYLWAPKREEEEEPEQPKPKPSPRPDPVPEDIVPTYTPHSLRRIDGGFVYAYKPEKLEEAEDADAQIVVSYRRRKSGKKKAPKSVKFRDFHADLPIEETGAADLEQAPEARRVTFKLSNISPGYELRVKGFDTNRDLELRLETVTA